MPITVLTVPCDDMYCGSCSYESDTQDGMKPTEADQHLASVGIDTGRVICSNELRM